MSLFANVLGEKIPHFPGSASFWVVHSNDPDMSPFGEPLLTPAEEDSAWKTGYYGPYFLKKLNHIWMPKSILLHQETKPCLND